MTHATTAYDEVPYKSYAFAQTHPMRLGAIATLFGMNPTPVEHCRVLELGCAAGGNIIPMAELFPESEFIGIDLSRLQIEEGQALLAQLQLPNCTLLHKSITDIDSSFGQFDYIIAHGVFSWVPDVVQDAMLRICRDNLSEQGVAYISYNTYPGWHMRGMIRDLMVYHAGPIRDPHEKLAHARALLHFLAQVAPRREPYGMILKEEAQHIDACDDYYLLHDYLEEHNTPYYFHQFMEKAQAHGLQYLSEANVSEMFISNFPEEVAEALLTLTDDVVRMEQYMDFVRNRFFRQTLLVRDTLRLDRNLGQNRNVRKLCFRMYGAPEALPDQLDNMPLAFRTKEGSSFTTTNPLVKAAFLHLFEHAHAMDFAGLLEIAAKRAGHALDEADATALDEALLAALSVHVIEPLTAKPPVETEAPVKPLTCASARRQAEKRHAPPTLWHEPLVSDPVGLAVIALCDGRHDQADMVEALMAQIQERRFTIADDDNRPIHEAETLRPMLGEALESILPALARMGLFKTP